MDKPATLGIRVPGELKEELDDTAADKGLSTSGLARSLLEDGLKQEQQDEQPTADTKTTFQDAVKQFELICWYMFTITSVVALLGYLFEIIGVVSAASAGEAYAIAFLLLPSCIILGVVTSALIATGTVDKVEALKRRFLGSPGASSAEV